MSDIVVTCGSYCVLQPWEGLFQPFYCFEVQEESVSVFFGLSESFGHEDVPDVEGSIPESGSESASVLLVCGAMVDEVFGCFVLTIAGWAYGGGCLLDAIQVLVEGNVTCSELEEEACLVFPYHVGEVEELA